MRALCVKRSNLVTDIAGWMCLLQNTEGGDTDSEGEADRLEEVESYLRVYDPDFKTSVAMLTAFNAGL